MDACTQASSRSISTRPLHPTHTTTMLSSAFPRIATRASRAQFGKVRIDDSERARKMQHTMSDGRVPEHRNPSGLIGSGATPMPGSRQPAQQRRSELMLPRGG